MALTCLSDSLHMMHAEIDGLHVTEAACEKGYPFHITRSALPLLHVLHLKDAIQMVYEFLVFLKFHYPCFPG